MFRYEVVVHFKGSGQIKRAAATVEVSAKTLYEALRKAEAKAAALPGFDGMAITRSHGVLVQDK